MSKNDYSCIVCYLLKYLYYCLKNDIKVDDDVFRLRYYPADINRNYWLYVVEHMLKDGYIDGPAIRQYPLMPEDEQKEVVDICWARITPRGIAYLEENSMMQKALGILQELKASIPFI